MKRIFLDCGTHFGEGFEYFRKQYNMDKDWDVHLFEPNPFLRPSIEKNILHKYPDWNIKHHSVAVGTKGMPDTANFKLECLNNDPTGGASTLVSPEYLKENQVNEYQDVTVNIVPISKIIYDIVAGVNKTNPESVRIYKDSDNHDVVTVHRDKCFIVLKLDVEGAEYDVLRELTSTGIGSWLTYAHIEFHHRRFKEEEKLKNREIELVGKLFQLGVGCFPHW